MTTSTKTRTKPTATKRTPRKAAPKPRTPKASPVPTEFTFEANAFGVAWLNMLHGTSKRGWHSEALESIQIEVHPAGLRLAATDSRLMLWCWQGAGDAPALAVEPLTTRLAFDPTGQLPGMLRWLASKACLGKNVTLTFDGPNTLLDAGDLRLVLTHPTAGKANMPVTFPAWRKLVLKYEKEFTTRTSGGEHFSNHPGVIGLAPELLRKILAIKGSENFIRIKPGATEIDALSFTINGNPATYGLVMPIRIS